MLLLVEVYVPRKLSHFHFFHFQAFEFGCSDEDMERSSIKASCVSGGLFILGSIPAVVPFACTNVRNDAVIAASVCCCAMLFVVGAAKTKVTRSNPWIGGFENMMYGAAGAASIAFTPPPSIAFRASPCSPPLALQFVRSSCCSFIRNWSALRLRSACLEVAATQ